MMRADDNQDRRHGVERPQAGREALERAVLSELSRESSAPDLTSPIMGRLGYMKVSQRIARRRRIRRLVGRAAACMVALGVIGVGLRVHEMGPDARRPVGPTIPSAIGNDVNYHQQRLKGTIRTIRNLVPETPRRAFPDHDIEKIDQDVDRSAVGPVRWL